jgi:DNA-binding NtrC family response regulator
VEAVSAFYQPGGAKDGALPPGKTVVCVDQSANVLAYVRELLRQAGYDPLTTANVSDARILIKAARPAVVILGPDVMVRGGGKSDALRQVLHGIPTIELGSAFSTIDAGEAARQVLAQVKAYTAGHS